MKPPIVDKTPTNWFLAGDHPEDYKIGTDNVSAPDGKSSGFIESINSNAFGFGTLMQMTKADKYRGERVKMSANIKTDNAKQWVGMWFRIDGEKESQLAFDNMADRPIRGTTDWTRYEIVLDVDKNAAYLAFGILLARTGKAWISDITFEVVNVVTPITNPDKIWNIFPERPLNLDFKS